jgi:hypothetical protein
MKVMSLRNCAKGLVQSRDCKNAWRALPAGMFAVAAIRISTSVALALLSTVALAQRNDKIKGVKFGAGCQEPIKPMAERLGACTLSSFACGVQMEKYLTGKDRCFHLLSFVRSAGLIKCCEA